MHPEKRQQPGGGQPQQHPGKHANSTDTSISIIIIALQARLNINIINRLLTYTLSICFLENF